MQTLKQQLPAWTELAQRLDPKNEQGVGESFFATDWMLRTYAVPASELGPLLREAEDWKKKYGRFKHKDEGASFCWTMARAKAELEDYEGAFLCINEGLDLQPKNAQTRRNLELGLSGLGLGNVGSGTAFAVSDQDIF